MHAKWAPEIDFRSNDDANETIPVVVLTFVSNCGSSMMVAVVDAEMAQPAAEEAMMPTVTLAANGSVWLTMLISTLAISLILIYCCHYSICSYRYHFE